MDVDDAKLLSGMRLEKRIMNISLIVAIFFFLIGLAAVFFSKSLALTIDVAYLFLDLCMVIITIFCLDKLSLPANKKYHFGYFKIEPMTVIIQCLFILGVCFFGFVFAIQQMIYLVAGNESNVSNYFVMMSFTGFSVLVCGGMWIYIATTIKQHTSDLLQVTLLVYKIDFYVCAGLFVSFFLGYLLDLYGFAFYAGLVDPLLSLILCAVLMHEPLRLLAESIRDLLDMNPSMELENKIITSINAFLINKYNLSGNAIVKLRKAGRRYFAIVHYPVNQDMKFEQVDQINKQLRSHFSKHFSDIHITYHPELITQR